MLATELHIRISAVCPIDGVAVGDEADRSTWRVDYSPSATEEQRGAAAAVVASFDVLESVKKTMSRRVDDDAEQVRNRYLTPGAGMALTYQEKFAQAQAVMNLGRETANALSELDREAQFPTLAASVGIEAPTLADAANLVLERYAAFARLSFHIERQRLAGKSAIQAAASKDDVDAAYRAITWTLL